MSAKTKIKSKRKEKRSGTKRAVRSGSDVFRDSIRAGKRLYGFGIGK